MIEKYDCFLNERKTFEAIKLSGRNSPEYEAIGFGMGEK